MDVRSQMCIPKGYRWIVYLSLLWRWQNTSITKIIQQKPTLDQSYLLGEETWTTSVILFLNFIPSRFTTTNNQPRINEMPQPKSRGHSKMLNYYTDIIWVKRLFYGKNCIVQVTESDKLLFKDHIALISNPTIAHKLGFFKIKNYFPL